MTVSDLVSQIRKAAQAYYEGEPIMSDEEFDKLVEELRALSPNDPLLSTPGWGYKVHLSEVRHRELVGGLNKIKIDAFDRAAHKDKLVMPKLDGITGVAYYVDGNLVNVVSRGDGEVGQDITANIRPGSVPRKVNPDITEVRGELVMSITNFNKLGGYSHPRNAAAGIANSKYAGREEINAVEFIAFSAKTERELDLIETLYWLHSNGFKIVDAISVDRIEEFNPVHNWRDYPIDGAVVASRDYKEVFAVKFQAESAIVTVTGIDWQESGFGRLIPVIEFTPVDLSGATLSRCSGFNAHSIKINNIGVGAKIRVCRSNEVIPHWMETIAPAINPDSAIPTTWNGNPVVWEGVHLKVIKDFEPQIVKTILLANTPDGIGGGTVNEMIKALSINTLEQLATVCNLVVNMSAPEALNPLRQALGTGDRYLGAIETLSNVINRPVDLHKALNWTWTRGLGDVAAEVIATECTHVTLKEYLLNLGELPAELESKLPSYVPGEGIKENRDNIIKVLNFPFNWVPYNKPAEIVTKYKVAITGALSKPRSQLFKEWAQYGVVESDVSKADFLVTDNPNSGSSKNKTAKKLGIRVVTESEFLEIVTASK